MRKLFLIGAFFAVFNAIACHGLSDALAHGTGHRLLKEKTAVTVEFFYSDNEPMSYAEILVFSPADRQVEYQNGRTDQKGRFSFYPETPGKWRVESGDGMGHKETAVIEVKKDLAGFSSQNFKDTIEDTNDGWNSSGSKAVSAVAGLSLILNFFLVLYMWKHGVFSKKNTEKD